MATAASVKAKIIGLIDKSNATTGNTDTDLTTAVDALVEGYGKGGSTVETQEKTVDITENGTTEVLPDEGFALSKVTVNTNVASVGDAPKLNAPTLNLALSNLLIEAADNGSFDDGYRLYIDGEQVAELAITTTTVDLSTYITEEGNYTISVVCYGDGFEDSNEASVTFSYVLRGVSYYGAIDPISPKRDKLLAASANDELAIFTGTIGDYDIDIYDKQLSRSVPSDSYAGWPYGECTAISIGEYAIFAGGRYSKDVNYVRAYNSEATQVSCTSLDVARSLLSSANIGNQYALISGGYDPSDAVNVYDSSLTKHESVALSVARGHILAASTKSRALFVGGCTASYAASATNVIDAFDEQLTRTSTTHKSKVINGFYEMPSDLAGEVGEYAIFPGVGYSSGSESANGDAYDDELTLFTFTKPLEAPSGNVVTVGDYAIVPTHTAGKEFSVYDIALTRTLVPRPTNGYAFWGTAIGEYAIFASHERTSPFSTLATEVYQAK